MAFFQQNRARVAGVLLVLAAPFLFFHRATFSEEVFVSRDILRVYYPLKRYWAERVSQLQFPDWYPHDGLGQPYAGMVISGAFHPTNLLYLLLPLGPALKLITLLSYLAALGGTYLFARLWSQGRMAALLAGFTYALGGYMVGISNNLLYLMAAATFPWALWGAERFLRAPSPARAASAALLLCLVLFSGDSQSFAVCSGLVLALALLRPERPRLLQALPRSGLVVLLGALLASVQLLPALTVLREATPGTQDLQVAQLFSFHPLRLLELPLGPVFVDPATGLAASQRVAQELLGSGFTDLWVSSAHLGAPAFLLLLGAVWTHRREPLTWKVVVAALLFLALALGRFLPVYQWLHQLVPLWRPFRYPEKLLPYLMFLCAVGAGAGLEALGRDVASRRHLALAGGGLALLLGVFALGEWQLRLVSDGVLRALWANPEPTSLELLHDNLVRASLHAAGALLLTGLVLLGVDKPGWRAGLVVALQVGVLYLANEGIYQVSAPDVLERPTSTVALILQREAAQAPVLPRVFGAADALSVPELPGLDHAASTALTLAAALEPNTPALWSLESANPYLPAVSRRFAPLSRSLMAWMGRFAGLYHVRYFTMSSATYQRISGNRDVVVSEDAQLGLVLLQNPRVLPRAYLASPVCVADAKAARERLLSKTFQPARQVVLECPQELLDAPPPAAEGNPGQVRFRLREPERVELDVEALHPAVLVLGDAFYDGWRATVDGEPMPILPANLAVRGVPVPAGTHRVVFTYRTPGRTLGELLSLGTLGLLGLAVLLGHRRRPATEASPP